MVSDAAIMVQVDVETHLDASTNTNLHGVMFMTNDKDTALKKQLPSAVTRFGIRWSLTMYFCMIA